MKPVTMRVGGHSYPTLEASHISDCGEIKDGIVMAFRNGRDLDGCFVVDFDDFEKAYLAAKAERADVIATRQERLPRRKRTG